MPDGIVWVKHEHQMADLPINVSCESTGSIVARHTALSARLVSVIEPGARNAPGKLQPTTLSHSPPKTSGWISDGGERPISSAASLDGIKSLVLDSVSSPLTRTMYGKALDDFLLWYASAPRSGFSKATVQAHRTYLEAKGYSASTINQRLSAIRKLAFEAADNGLMPPELASSIGRVRGAKLKGVRTWNWLSNSQAETLVNAPDVSTLKGKRDRAILAVLIGCGLRRSEVVALRVTNDHENTCG